MDVRHLALSAYVPANHGQHLGRLRLGNLPFHPALEVHHRGTTKEPVGSVGATLHHGSGRFLQARRVETDFRSDRLELREGEPLGTHQGAAG